MKVRRSVIFPIFAAGILVLVFVFGQLFYYDQKIKILLNQAHIPVTSKASADTTDILQQKFILKSEKEEFVVEPAELNKWAESYTRAYTGKQELRIDGAKVSAYLEKISDKTYVPATNPKFKVTDDGKINELEPAHNGRKLNVSASATNIIASLIANKNSGKSNGAELVFDKVLPVISLDKALEYGIGSLLASGESDYSGSPKSRVHNIAVGSRQFSGILIKPGEEFSFNQILGEVDASSGYLPELVIKSSGLVPEYGGGLCQVSTTLFRAVAVAGLPVIERRPHSIPVRYYNPQGFDATIYPGVTDFRFLNDTPSYLLLQSRIAGSKIYFEIYGKNDGRKIELDGPHQYDIQPNGALKAELLRVVTYPDGTQKRDLFRSSYKAPGSATIRNPLE